MWGRSGPVVCKLCGEEVDLSYVSYVGKKGMHRNILRSLTMNIKGFPPSYYALFGAAGLLP